MMHGTTMFEIKKPITPMPIVNGVLSVLESGAPKIKKLEIRNSK